MPRLSLLRKLAVALGVALVAATLALGCASEDKVEDGTVNGEAQQTPIATAWQIPTPAAAAEGTPVPTPTPAATATPTLPAEPSPTPLATSTALPTDLDWEKAEQSAIADNAKPRFRGVLGDFVVVEPNSGSNYPCPEPYGPAVNLESSEPYFNLPGAVIDDVEAGACQGTVVSITAGVPDETSGTLVGRGYFLGPKMRVSFDAPAERLKLITVAGKPALAHLPIPDCISCLTEVVVIERFPTEAAPGITAWAHTYSGLDRAIALVEQIMAGGKR
jgi:hypothetical protein